MALLSAGLGPARGLRPQLLPLQPPKRAARPSSRRSGGGGRVSAAKHGNKWGNDNRLAPAKLPPARVATGEEEWAAMHLGGESAGNVKQGGPSPARKQDAVRASKRFFGEVLYHYYNWRKDTFSDLQLFLIINSVVFLLGAWVRGSIIRLVDTTVPPPPPLVDGPTGWWTGVWFDLYNILSVVLGQDLPEQGAGFPSQVFAVLVAVLGLASFALVLALIEQVVLEVLESNVRRGSRVYETGHTVVMAWCESARDVSLLTRILTQLCAANRAEGGGVVVVLTQGREKLEMESIYRETIPEEQRFGTQLVFRQGSPLDPLALRQVACPEARAVIISSDYSRSSLEADAQVLRAAVLLDEMMQNVFGPEACGPGAMPAKGPLVAAQVKSRDGLALLQYACSKRVVPVATAVLNARRYARLLWHPITAHFSHLLTDFNSDAHAFIDAVPQLEGKRFGDLHAYFPDGTVLGVINDTSGYLRLNPPPSKELQPGDELVMLRPSHYAQAHYQPLTAPLEAPGGLGGWNASAYERRSLDDQPLGLQSWDAGAGDSRPSDIAAPTVLGQKQRGPTVCRKGMYVLPLQYTNTLLVASDLLICGWMGEHFMWELLGMLDHSAQALPEGSRVTLFNDHKFDEQEFAELLQTRGIHNIAVTHVRGDPRSRTTMACRIDVSQFKAAIVLMDSKWLGQGKAESAGHDSSYLVLSQADMVRLDAEVLMTQLNIRMLLEEKGLPDLNIVVERLSYVGVTPFEDPTRLPLGISVNSASFAAKALTQVAHEPRFTPAYMQLGVESDIVVQDSSAFAAEGEELSYLQVQARCSAVQQVLMGYYRVPNALDEGLEVAVNPGGVEERTRRWVWNAGNCRLKVVTLALKSQIEAARIASVLESSSYGSDDPGALVDSGGGGSSDSAAGNGAAHEAVVGG